MGNSVSPDRDIQGEVGKVHFRVVPPTQCDEQELGRAARGRAQQTEGMWSRDCESLGSEQYLCFEKKR